MRARFLSTCIWATLAACGGGDDDGGAGDPDGGGDPGSDAGSNAAPDADGFAPILTVDWTLDPPDGPNPDKYVTWGDSSNEEMYFAGFYRYPATGQTFCGFDF